MYCSVTEGNVVNVEEGGTNRVTSYDNVINHRGQIREGGEGNVVADPSVVTGSTYPSTVNDVLTESVLDGNTDERYAVLVQT